jgi:hypothetical protein
MTSGTAPDATERSLKALYYPFARCTDENTLKRAILLYDEVVFVDPKSARVRAGLYSVANHQQYLPGDAARKLEAEWTDISDRYQVLTEAGAVSFFDPTAILASPSIDELITSHLDADMCSPGTYSLFERSPASWSILRSRIPRSAFTRLHHQYTPRVLYEQNIRGPFFVDAGGPQALFSDGKPEQDFSGPGGGRRPPVVETPDEFACVVPYYLGSSLAVSLALVAATELGAIPFTDSTPHHRLLALRYQRANAQRHATTLDIPGLTDEASPGVEQATGLINLRLFDTVLSPAELGELTFEQCLRYRERTAKERKQYRAHLHKLTERVRNGPWSPAFAEELRTIEDEAKLALKDHQAGLRSAYLEIARKAAVGLAVTGVPALTAVAFPGISPVLALLLGAGGTALAKEPIKDLIDLWSKRITKEKNGLAYLFDLKATATPD